MRNLKKSIKPLAIAAVLITVAIAERTVIDLGYNIELVTVTMLVASVYLPRQYAVIVPMVAIIISDLIIGNSQIFIFTWSAWIVMGIMSLKLNALIKKYHEQVLTPTLFSYLTATFFYFWTNFGVWVLARDHGWYAPTLKGLFDSLVAGIPFYRVNVISNSIIVSVTFASIEIARNYLFSTQKQKSV